MSKHLSILRDAGLLDSRKKERWVYYRMADKPMFPIVGKQAAAVFKSLEKSPTVKGDDKHLRAIKKMGMEELCRRLFCRP